MQTTKTCHFKIIALLAALPATYVLADVLQPSTITLVDTQYNSTTWAASNLQDGDSNTHWLSSKLSNNINFQLNDSNEAYCVEEFELTNYGKDSSSLKQFMLLTTSDSSLSADSGTDGWRPIVAEQNPTAKIDYLSWAQGARLVSVDSEYNSTTYGAKNLNDGSNKSRWLSKKSNNTIEFNFDTDWNGNAGNSIPISEIQITNYGNDDRSVKEFQIEVTTDGVTWNKLEVPGSVAGDDDYIYSRTHNGGVLGTVDSEYNATTWAAENMQDGDDNSLWLSRKNNNTIEFSFDPNSNGTTGAEGDTDDVFTFSKFNLRNYGAHTRSVQQFQIAVQTLSDPSWQKIYVPGSAIGDNDFNFAMSHNGGTLVEIDSELNSTSWGADNIHDGDANSRWLSSNGNNTLAFQFDVDEDGLMGTATDYFTLESFRLRNYGNDDRSIKQFQVSVKTASNPTWQKIAVPGSTSGEANYNFALTYQGGTLTSFDSQYNSTSLAAKNIHDGDGNSSWLSNKTNNFFEFQFDADGDGSLATAADQFTLQSFYLKNYGNDDRAINEFQVAVKTSANPNWQKLSVPGSVIGEPDYNFALAQQGGTLVNIDSQYNATSYAAANLHDGDLNSSWLSSKSNNTLDFQFDLDDDGNLSGAGDRFKLEGFNLVNYGNNDISIKYFQIEVKTLSNPDWIKIPVAGSGANEPNHNFSLSYHGGSLTTLDSEYNSTSYAAKNLHDGDQSNQWLSSKQNNTLAFTFDTDNDGTNGDPINFDTFSLVNYGNNISIQTFELDIQISNGPWQTINAPDGGTTFTANMDNDLQTWSVGAYNNVTATRIRTLSNYGHSTFTGARELTFSGDSVGPTYTYTAAKNNDGESFSIDPAYQFENITDVRLRTISNYGHSSYIGAKEFKLLGPSVSESKTFKAAMHSNGELFSLDSEDIPVNVTDVKLITISNHGDPSYIGAREFELLGLSVAQSKTFTAAMNDSVQTFTLDPADVPTDVTDVKLVTISNHGDNTYIGAREFELLGPSITRTKIFTAAMHSNGETFQLDEDDIPEEVTAVKLITINNHGDTSYIGLREFEVIGESVTPSTTFSVPMSAAPYDIVLDEEDEVTDVIGARLVTIKNHGDPSYTGIADFKLLGTAITPSYIFTAENTTLLQSYDFDPITTNILRFRSLNNYGSSSYVRATDFKLNEGVCKNAQWRMDETSWNGTANEVKDSTNSGYDAVSVGYGVGTDPTTSAMSPALEGDPGSCGYGEFDGVDDYIVSANGDSLDELTAMTLSAWIKASSFNQTNGTDSRGVFSKGPDGVNGVSYGAFFTNSGGNRLYVDIDGANDRFQSNTSFVVDTWYHIAIVFDGTQDESERVKLYVNGTLDGTFSESSSLIPNTSGDFYIGNLYSSANQKSVFHGAIDEVNLRPTALNAAEVSSLMGTTRSCTVPLHHIQIEHDGDGLTCSAEPVTLKACANLDCTDLVPIDVNVTLAATGSPSTWSNNPITIPSGETVSVEFNHTTAETITLSAETDVPAMSDLECIPDCDIVFSSGGYLLSLEDHTACSTTNLTIQAVKVGDSSTSCAAAENGDLSLDLVFNYANPTTGTKVPTLDSTAMAAASVTQNRIINFDESGTAVLSFEYQDAGKISIEVNDASGNGLASSTVTTVVSPAKLIVASPDANAECTTNDASCNVFKKAGEDFNLSVAAACSDGTITANFEMKNIPLTVDTVAPLTGNSVSLGVANISIDTADNGVKLETNQSVSEVGVFTITATPPVNGYFGKTIDAATSESIGRFTPAYFDLETVFDGFLSGGDPFVYAGQMNIASPASGQISYATEPEFTITAKSLDGHTTLNYTGDFVNLDESNIVRVSPTEDSSQIGADATTNVSLSANLKSPTITEMNGVISYQFNSTDNFIYERNANALVEPFTSNLSLKVTSVIDADGITANDSDGNAANGVLELLPFGEEVRFGRWVLKNNYGPETTSLNIPMQIEYWDGSRFVISSEDNFTRFDAATDVNITDISLAPGTTSASGAGTFESGRAEFLLSPPGVNNQGDVQIEFEVPTWLQFDWSDIDSNYDGPYTENPSSVATFGIFHGNDRMIHWREKSN
ncbi:LamG-like jellyroll fold domain-containing protein [Aliiglaciecola sp. 2_MG-2023]|uniref:DUF6701 domain-containing protein n=1 Tax=unclassified Aliiglaciecola TaxID=2593648 RepID=UPI0026E3C966|nr:MULTISPECIES: DUF6701 domain-containing protein [unclassified Aliiglaciecola]MDO6713118.1 LamG-like jellyroll fold domain-containing protein [Aliiglaciecola sp. 2_MG-2023]MDO6754116.1 LamG-like jellyroll fold domain-containing protein [Aliiglaciecola sp. 1_MG-2023]